ncbi:MAG: prephenate/arogenate dehydrogenase family protein [Hyphomonadaceae bacterium]|nr:prephenate/arogenate dehydrogenase family protein [Hyphomonadaceae bacterium]MBC6413141.1 prephenate/arogenate dehydrogenase family protein [Hyphomonadaceae bacterium]
MTVAFTHVHIIGIGLIGSSLARAVKAHDFCQTLTLSDVSGNVCATARKLRMGDRVDTDPTKNIGTADVVILATPPSTMGHIACQIRDCLKPGAVLMDVGSVKGPIMEAVSPHVPDHATFIPAHPIAGTENSGPESGFATLFQDRWCILTPENPHLPEVQTAIKFWEAIGSGVVVMDANRHDIVMAVTSHVPHLIAYTLVGTAMDMETVTRNEVIKFSAGGFRDFTRIAASDPTMWRDVFLANKSGVLEVVDRFIEDLSALKRAIRWGEMETLETHLARTRDIRRRIIDAGQDVETSNFGRDN